MAYKAKTREFKMAIIFAGTSQKALCDLLKIDKSTLNNYISARRGFPEHHIDATIEHLKVHKQEILIEVED